MLEISSSTATSTRSATLTYTLATSSMTISICPRTSLLGFFDFGLIARLGTHIAGMVWGTTIITGDDSSIVLVTLGNIPLIRQIQDVEKLTSFGTKLLNGSKGDGAILFPTRNAYLANSLCG
jgi:hypothetical protein